ncbi:MAG TPA: mechanosensitive ion channel protein MscS [Flavobacteriaceae bacterium]|jgi:small-conductance mechanosensitive channel|nr:mechanosensitive ion channel protein MscS [Flavobacteriaceae bacterium]HBS11871.1 mechanosensitive ion channel protein MscS [Flavobacteriaceae bacterium]
MKIGSYILELTPFWQITLYIIIVIVTTWLISRIIRFFLTKHIDKKNSKHQYSITRLKFINNSLKFFLGIIALFIIILTVPQLRSKAGFIFSGAGILAAIIGFAAQAAVSNLIAGAFIVLFKPFRVGDFIKLDDSRLGIVEDITLRHTVINTFENKRLIIPNSLISTESIFNHTIDDTYVQSFNNIMVGLYADIDKVKQIIREEALKLSYIIDNRTPEQIANSFPQIKIRIKEINENGIYLRAFIWVTDPYEEFRVKSELLEAVHKRFLKEGVDLPVPKRKIIDSSK